VIADRRRDARAVFVTAVTAFAIVAAPGTIAQGVRDIPWWHELQGPDGPTQTFLLQTVQGMPASAFDPKLPAIALDTWLRVTLAPVIEVSRPQPVEWRVSFCLDPVSEIPGPGPELCAEGTARLSAEKTVQIVIVVADAVRSPTTDRPQWRPKRPTLRDVYIERLQGSTRVDSLDVPALGLCGNCSMRPSSGDPPSISRARSLGTRRTLHRAAPYDSTYRSETPAIDPPTAPGSRS
jgi:hypothetical protein